MSTKYFSTLDTSCLKSLARLALLFAAFLSKNNICNRKMEWLGYLLFFVVFLTVLNYLTLRCPWKADKSLPNKVKLLELISLLSTLSWNCFLKLGCFPNEIFLYWDNVPQQIFWSLQRLLLGQDCSLCRVFCGQDQTRQRKARCDLGAVEMLSYRTWIQGDRSTWGGGIALSGFLWAVTLVESYNHWVVWVGRNLKLILFQSLCG